MKREYIVYGLLALIIAACTFGAVKFIELQKELKEAKNLIQYLQSSIDGLNSDISNNESNIEEATNRIDDAESRIDDLENTTITVTTDYGY